MRYFDKTEELKKEKRLAEHPLWAQRIFKNMLTVHDIYDDLLRPYVNKNTVVLDAGCGKKGIMIKYKGKLKYVAGIDLSPSVLKQNNSLDSYVMGNLNCLPFADEAFDTIISQWAVEHIPDPVICFSEFHRVLKKKGGLIVVTNSIYNPLMFFSSIFHERIRDVLKTRLLPPEIEEGTFPTYYRCNSLKKMGQVLESIGFSKVSATYEGDVSFFIFSRLLFPLFLFYEKITNVSFLRQCKMHLLVHYYK